MSQGRILVLNGVHAVRRKPWLVFLLYGVGLVLSYVYARTLVAPMHELVSLSGFADRMAEGFDARMWTDLLMESHVDLLATTPHLLWLIPTSVVWKAAASVGMLHTLQDNGHSFWLGALRYVLPSLFLGAFFLFLIGIVLLAGVIFGVLISQIWPGEVGFVWIWLIIIPILLTVGISIVTVLRDVARAAMVVRGKRIWAAVGSGIKVPFRHRGVWTGFIACVISGSIVAMTSLIDSTVVQQSGLIVVAALIVGWYGCLAAYVQDAMASPEESITSPTTENEVLLRSDAAMKNPGPHHDSQ